MDAQRTILIVALLVVSYLMVLAWNEDYGQQPYSQQTISSSSASQPTATGSTPSLTDQTHFEVPEAQQSSSATGAPAVNQAGTIRVETDVLTLQISRQGGNLVE